MNLFYVADLLFIASSWALVVAASFGLWRSPIPIWLSRSIVGLGFVLLAASTVIAYAYTMELFMAYYSANAYVGATFQTGVTGIDAVASWLFVGSRLFLQLFWLRRFRTRPLPALIIALASAIPSALERVIISLAT